MTRRIVIPYEPRLAFLPFHASPARFQVLVAHRRAGKTVACVNRLIRSALTCPLPRPRVAYIAPYLRQAKDIAWDYAKHYAAPVINDVNESELRLELVNGARLRLYGADNADALRGSYFDDVVLDEYADMRPSVWGEVLRPALSDRRGRAAFIGTPKGRNEFWRIFDGAQLGFPDESGARRKDADWHALMFRASETGIVPNEELEAARRDLTPEQYEQEFECSFEAAIMGAFFGREMAEAERSGRLMAKPIYEPTLPVHTAWDLGMSDSTAIWFFQVAANEIRVIDFYQANGLALPHYVSMLASKPYKYGDDWLPHDAKVRELGTGRSRVETLKSLGRTSLRLVPDHHLMDGINAARMTLARCWFDAAKCNDGIEALRQYRREYDQKTRAFRQTPRHDWTSHAADAFRYLSMAWRELTATAQPARQKWLHEMTYEEAFPLNKPKAQREWRV